MRRALLGAALLLGALVGCSDDGDDDLSPPTTDAPTEPLVASFTYEPDYEVTGPTSCPLRDITFTDTSDGGPEEWRWEFSDGSTSTEQNPVVATFISEATLTITRGDDSDSATEDVLISVC